MPPQEIITETSPFLLEALETCLGPYEALYDERDCLNINLFMPTTVSSGSMDRSDRLPVFVWLFGGGFRRGGNGIPLLDATNFVARSIALSTPLIVVVPNYRTNYLGFLSSTELQLDNAVLHRSSSSSTTSTTSSSSGSIGNWGLQDQILALEWVQEYIPYFGGTTARVTLAGESAGAVSIGHLMRVQQSHGLFHRAIVQSGAAAMVPAGYPEDGQMYFDHLCRVFKVPEGVEGTSKVDWLRENVSGREMAQELGSYQLSFFRPYIDHVLVRDDGRCDPKIELDPGVEWVVAGCCRDEGSLLAPMVAADTLAKFQVLRTRLCGERAVLLQLFDRLYGVPNSDAAALEASVLLTTDGMFRYPLLALSQQVQTSSKKCRLSRFHFDCSLQKIHEADPTIGAHHGSDLLFLFGANEVSQHLTEREKALSVKMQEVWIQVATSDVPNSGPGSLSTVQETSGERSLLNEEAVWFKEDCTVSFTSWFERLSEDEIAFWRDAMQYHSEQAALGVSPDVGFGLLKPINGRA
ncbi:hypothetical protein BGZ59_008125 [Podila verticillata]|nr:hypothetical protein BGZ59_008125 [Podila verticillata]